MSARDTQSNKPSICLVSLDAYGAFCGGTFGHVGGVERQTSLMARWLAARGYRVSMVTWAEGPCGDEVIDGVQLIKTCPRSAGLPGLRFVHPRWTSLIDALRRADADLYYHNSAEYLTGQVAQWCRWRGRRFVYSVASDPACDPSLPLFRTLRERTLYRYGIRACDLIVVQTRMQRDMLQHGMGRDSLVIPMPCPGPTPEEFTPPTPPADDSPVLWVGRVAPMKRLELFLAVAAALPERRFQVAGSGDSLDARGLLERARTISNVRILGMVPRSQMPSHYCAAACLCCTSAYEGFPNTFLEAWSHGIPVISTQDPDALIARRRLGFVAQDVQGIVEAIRRLFGHPGEWCECSENARRYYLEHHTPDAALARFERAFLDLLDPGGALPVPHFCSE